MSVHGHYSTEQILQYFTDELPELERMTVERHLGDCDYCAGRARRAFQMTAGWTAQTHAQAVQAESRQTDPLVQALVKAQTLYGQFSRRFQAWLNGAQAAWNAPGLRIATAGAGAIPVRGTETPILTISLSAETRRVRVTVRGRPRTVQVTLGAISNPDHLPLLLLFGTDESAEPRLAVMSTAGSVFTAQFDAVPAGNYLLAIEPAE